MIGGGRPVLWHIGISHYSEKVRWALAHKGVEHDRRAPPPGVHMLVALALTRGRQNTFPVLDVGGQRIGDSSTIIEALERRFPEPPLYPEDAADRRRALELEDWFDEQLGPHARVLGWHEFAGDSARLRRLAVEQSPRPLRLAPALAAATAVSVAHLRYGVKSDERAEEARRKVLAALDRLEAELGDGEYLVGGRFTVADLTAAALFYPLVLPAEGPRLTPDPPPALERFRAPLKERPGYRWVEEMFRRHRRPQVAAAPVGA